MSKEDKIILNAIKGLKKCKEWGIISTDKTNGHIPMEIKDIREEMIEHISKKCTEVDVPYLKEVHEKAIALWTKYNGLMSAGESAYLENFINSRDVPVPRLIMKDPKKKKANGRYPSRMLIPATNFTQGIAKFGFNIVKNVFDRNDVLYKKYIINRAQILKSDVERIDRNATIEKEQRFVCIPGY